ncbi:MFS transporter [Aspergillus homomorphus CBS 101889]|uniref:MFS general substrate transporter n=1 Tax=Aspergillus homomorphus (strain CBS 101889) TaxID=1450537 RepID=A0A395HUK2_ASPHC|nr:MFS general substrate transporter [Aspergillus homomorphus CBS 101889]RAL11480.1 MFS general substrate transporter [Aspergillus homomorphus CBS 101889]
MQGTAATTPATDIPPVHAVNVAPRWNESRTMVWRLSATFWCALVMGANDAAYGAIISYLELDYRKSYTIISLVFLSPFAGYTISAVLSHLVHQRLGRRGVAILGAGCHLLPFIVIAIHPPFPVLVIMYMLIGLGSGIQSAAWNVWIGNMANSHEVLGFFHGFYGLGATTSPLVATSLITKAGWSWYSFYYLMAGAAAIDLIYSTAAFWPETGTKYRHDNPSSTSATSGSLHQTRLSLTYRVTWICAIFLFLYGGIEVTIGGWIVVFMTSVRHGSAFASGMTETGFWLGITVGRFVLGFVSPRVGEKLSIAGYIVVAIVLELIFWLVPQFIVSALAVALVGFFLGTIFPGVVALSTRLLPKSLHVAAIGFAAAFSMGGGAVFPFMIGAVAQAKGVTVLQPMLLAMLTVALGIWGTLFWVPRAGLPHEV